jgi:hypothetical protein
MKTKYQQLCTTLFAVIVLVLSASNPVYATVIYMNFDSVDASGGDVYATSYLASFGVTLTNVIADGIAAPDSVHIGSSQYWYGGAMCTASSLPNFLVQSAWAWTESYTLNFSTPLQDLSFTRCAYTTWGGAATPGWTATAYIGTTAIGTVGSPSINQDYAAPAHTYAFSGAGITSLTIVGYPHDSHGGGFGGAACGSAPLDDFYMTIPEPATLTLLVLGGLMLRKK